MSGSFLGRWQSQLASPKGASVGQGSLLIWCDLSSSGIGRAKNRDAPQSMPFHPEVERSCQRKALVCWDCYLIHILCDAERLFRQTSQGWSSKN